MAVPAHGCPVVACGAVLRDQGDELERGGEVEVSEFSCGEFGLEEVSALDRALEAALWCPLRRHRGAPLGFRLRRICEQATLDCRAQGELARSCSSSVIGSTWFDSRPSACIKRRSVVTSCVAGVALSLLRLCAPPSFNSGEEDQ